MITARLRGTRSAWPCSDHVLAHSPQKRAETLTRGEIPPLIPSREHKQQAERARQQGSLPGRAATLVAVNEVSRACPVGVALRLNHLESLILERVLKLHLKALTYNLENLAQCQVKPDLAIRGKESEIVQRLYDLLKDVNKSNIKTQ